MSTTTPTPSFRGVVIYDTANSIQGASAAESREIRSPHAVQVEAIAVGTTVLIQVRLHPTGTWVTVKTLTSADGVYLHTFYPYQPNYVRLSRSAGTGAVLAFAQV